MGELDIATLPEDNPLRADFDALLGGGSHEAEFASAQRLTDHFSGV